MYVWEGDVLTWQDPQHCGCSAALGRLPFNPVCKGQKEQARRGGSRAQQRTVPFLGPGLKMCTLKAVFFCAFEMKA